MKPIVRLLGFLAVASFTALPGCVQFEQTTLLMPDGSGKLVMKVGFKKSMLEMIKQFGGQDGQKVPDPFEQVTDPTKLKDNGEGFAAWGEPKKEEDGDWLRMTVIGYFEDINKVKLYNEQDQGGEKKKTLSFAAKYERKGEGGRLTMSNEMGDEFKKMSKDLPGADGNGNEELAKAMLEAMKPMLEGMKVTIAMTVPGPIESAGGLPEMKDRTASFSIDGNMMIALIKDPKGPEAKKMEALGEAAKKGEAITWSKTTVSPDDVAAFQKEMAQAKESWAKRLKEAESKKKDQPKGDEKPKEKKDF
jgi:hypothetical protein